MSALKVVTPHGWCLFHPGFMVQHFANLSLSCLRGQLEGLITDLLGLYSHVSMTPPPTASMKDCLLASQGVPMRPWSWLKHKLMAVIYCMAHVCISCVLFMCACVSRTLAPTGSWPYNPPPYPPPSISQQCNGSCEGRRKRRGKAKMAVISFCWMCHLFSLGEKLVEGWRLLTYAQSIICQNVPSVQCLCACVWVGAPDCFVWPITSYCMCLHAHSCLCVHVCVCTLDSIAADGLSLIVAPLWNEGHSTLWVSSGPLIGVPL